MDTVPWNRVILDEFCSLAILTPLEENIVRTGATKWGKLKSGAGWISLDYTTKV